MKFLVVGSGAREHSIASKLCESPLLDALFIAPGNAGTTELGTNLPIDATNITALADAARLHDIDMTFVGPEAPLDNGIVDLFLENGLAIFGPTSAAAQIEASKAFAKEFMQRHDIPCAQSVTFDCYHEAHRFLEHRDGPVVIKADGLAAGKGVTVASTRAEAMIALDACMNQRIFGDAGDRVVIEEFLEGPEVSVFAFTDGQHLSPLIAACDYKRAYDGDMGPNTGGMGTYSPPRFWNEDLAIEAERRIFKPTIHGLAEEDRAYQGVIYGGLILTSNGLRVLEFNARLGDPEAQVILPLLNADLVEIAKAVVAGKLTETPIHWSTQACVAIVIASKGYPESYVTGFPISGLAKVKDSALVFHGGTKQADAKVITNGGRVLTIVGLAPTLTEARDRAYSAAQQVQFQGAFYRHDIASPPEDLDALDG